MNRTSIALALAASLVAASPAAAHFVTVRPAGGDSCVVRHVGQLPPDHNSMAGHTSAAAHEQSAVVTFGRPGTC